MRGFFAFALILLLASPALAREAAFVDPGTAKKDGAGSNEVVFATPSHTDVGETIIGVSKRLTLFFTNSGARKAVINTVTVTADGNVLAELIDNDCKTIGELPVGERCSVGIAVTPNSPGPWTAEVLMLHDAPGRVTQAMLMGITSGEVGNSGQQPGLSLLGSNKDKQIDFGDVEVGFGRAVRSVLLVNDSPNSLVVTNIDLVAADKTLTLIAEGACGKGMEIPAAGSCPVTVMWQPLGRGDVSTDLIISHTGPVGFAIIPVRGRAVGGGAGGAMAGAPRGDGEAESAAAGLPVGKAPSISAAALFAQAAGSGAAGSRLVLRGTVGDRAILSDANGNVTVAKIGDTITVEGVAHKVISVTGNQAVVDVDGSQVELSMGSGIGGGSKNPAAPPGSKTMKGSELSPAITPVSAAKVASPAPSAAVPVPPPAGGS